MTERAVNAIIALILVCVAIVILFKYVIPLIFRS